MERERKEKGKKDRELSRLKNMAKSKVKNMNEEFEKFKADMIEKRLKAKRRGGSADDEEEITEIDIYKMFLEEKAVEEQEAKAQRSF